jgi:hypothetical protein
MGSRLDLEQNTKSMDEEKIDEIEQGTPLLQYETREELVFNGTPIMIRDGKWKSLWKGPKHLRNKETVGTATDGSTYPGKPSGYAVIYITDSFDKEELWQRGSITEFQTVTTTQQR